ncbi:hypothetical protein SAY86_000516 [Trapa natans]|uniref:Exonuclease domain-containing protein n=1 Tax=Trapa natans TaxID=22666 RepID=A0AAN7N1K5_TRANT|nr:hypothetical protein SAY86_000516 [Trapa natans]
MRTPTMCYSILQFSRSVVPRIVSFRHEGFHSPCPFSKNNSDVGFLGLETSRQEGGSRRRWICKPISSKAGGNSRITGSKKSTDIRSEILEESISAAVREDVNRTKVTEFHKIEHYDIQQSIDDKKSFVGLVTTIVFDLETTGFSRDTERIIEIAFRDLSGGENSTFQTLVNPQRYIMNHFVHGIRTDMVNRPDIPRMQDLIPILLKYVESRQKPGGIVLLIAHNARTFDVPFLVSEFNRCNFEIPPHWRFMDTLTLAREVMKSKGAKVAPKISLQALREFYGIELDGSSHRAMSDVNVLSHVFQRLTFDLKMSLSDAVSRSFAPSELSSGKKKKDSR